MSIMNVHYVCYECDDFELWLWCEPVCHFNYNILTCNWVYDAFMWQDGNLARDGDNPDESSDEELFRLLVDDDDKGFLDAMLLFADHYDKYCNKAKRRKPIETRLQWVERNLRDGNKCYNMFRMSLAIFDRLHDLLVESYGLKSSTKSTSVEALGMFL